MTLRAKDITVLLNGKNILTDVNLNIDAGTFTAIVGPNGAGKSTLLKIFSGERKSTAGDATLFDKPVSSYNPQQLATHRAVLSQHATLSFAFPVDEVVALSLHLHKYTRQQISRRVTEALHVAGIHHLKTRSFQTLSGGEQQRVHLARALAQVLGDHHEPRFLLLDEPTNNLDLEHQHSILHAARELTANNIGVLAILHDLNLAAQYADNITILHDGRIHATGVPEMVLTSENIATVFKHPVKIIHNGHHPYVMALPKQTHLPNKQNQEYHG